MKGSLNSIRQESNSRSIGLFHMKSKEPRSQWIFRNQTRLFELHTNGSLTCWIGCVSRPVAGFVSSSRNLPSSLKESRWRLLTATPRGCTWIKTPSWAFKARYPQAIMADFLLRDQVSSCAALRTWGSICRPPQQLPAGLLAFAWRPAGLY